MLPEEDSIGRRGYPAEFRRRVLKLVEAGKPVAEVATDLGISHQTIYEWRRQHRIDRGLEPGILPAARVTWQPRTSASVSSRAS